MKRMQKNKVKCGFCDADLLRYPTKTNTYFCGFDCKAKWQILQREKQGFTEEWLINQYFELGKDCNQIGREIGRDGKSVWNWFAGYGIQINKRGTYYEKNLVFDGSTFRGKKHSDESKEKIRGKRIEDGHVPYLKNGVHWLKTVGREDHPKWKGGLTPARQELYASQEWAEAVKQVWHRDNAICQNCGIRHNTKTSRGTFHIHHIVSFKIKEFRKEVSNLVLLCKKCHKWVHSKENTNSKFIKQI